MKLVLITRSNVLLLCIALFTVDATARSSKNSCDLRDLQICRSCNGLAKAIDISKPDYGDYYRGAYWNGLYVAYRLNCQTLGVVLLKNGANPNLGGSFGSFLISVVGSWPHNNVKINRQWVKILRSYAIDIHWKGSFTSKSAKEIFDSNQSTIDYPELWRMLKK